MATISKNLERQVQKGTITGDGKNKCIDSAFIRLQLISEGVREADLIIEAATENEDIKLQIFQRSG